ncbi:MAG TPA: NAD-binding protein [Burkholderiaceae bacterium]|nr:NAD-binding protein [Burkholderiaceae bacterium]
MQPAHALAAPRVAGKPHRRHKLGRPRLLIVGCGDVGLRILSRLASRYRVVALTSTPARVMVLRDAGAVPIVGDLDRRSSLRRLRGCAPWLLHLAPPADDSPRDTRTRHLMAVLAGATRRAVYISTTGVYGDHAGRLIDETARLSPANERARRRVDAERVMRDRCRATVLRVPGIYAHDRLPLERLRRGLPALLDADDVYTSHVHADDLARICITALLRGAAARVYNAVDGSSMKMGEYFNAVADASGLPCPPRLPRAQLQAAVSPVMYSFMTESRQLVNRRLVRELRVRLLYPTVANALASLTGQTYAFAERENGPRGPSS